MDDDFDDLVVSVRADTAGFAQDVAQMRRSFDTTLADGLEGAGQVLERSLLRAIENGKLGFDDLKRVGLQAMEQIASSAISAGIDTIFAGVGIGGGGDFLGGLLSGLTGLPGRATGGLVGPDRPYLVGERGPELFVPAGAGRVEPTHALGGTGKDVRVSITLATPRGESAPTSLRRSSRQVASTVRRGLSM